MGSLKDEMRGLHEEPQPCEKKQDRERPGSSDGSAAPGGPQLNAGRESASDDTDRPDGAQTDALPPAGQHRVDKTAAAEQKDTADRDEVLTVRQENADPEKENALFPEPSAADPSDPNSPAPFGQHHMRTQVSLEVVQCCSAATSPMTPPEGAHSFFFPASFGRPGAAGTDTKDAELQVGRRAQVCSVATSPMTPKTPSVSAFPELSGRETAPGKGESFPSTTSESKISAAPTRVLDAKSSQETSTDRLAQVDSQVTPEDGDRKQQRMGSMDQDITILVTHHGNTEEEDEEEEFSSGGSHRPAEAETVDPDVSAEGVDYESNAERVERDQAPDASSPPPGRNAETDERPAKSEAKENKDGDPKDFPPTKSAVPESPAPFGCHNIRTQVSLEVVQCQSVATSPMTPPDGDNAFRFPNSAGGGGGETRDAELQVGQRVEFRSVATAPMTPRTPTAAAFPDFRKEVSVEEKIVEVEEQVSTPGSEEEEENVTGEEERAEAAEGGKEEGRNREEDEEKCEEPVQEVSWDEKGMTWEVYGAVVEVAVLGSAIQKHLEKQVKKQKSQSSLPPPPPLNPSATPLVSEHPPGGLGSGKGRGGKRGERGAKASRGRRNPFRLLMENMQQPHCCSKAHTTE